MGAPVVADVSTKGKDVAVTVNESVKKTGSFVSETVRENMGETTNPELAATAELGI
jgi:hypothetical protein